ncbi:PIR protein [Plasmodium vivax]|uniref:VIR protein n=1 Tax=Plasmodium vivax TaxID=5855 RepID=A0A565A035_PLAVI|nr:PIR protein [Plasmodium vivax]
MDCIVSQKEADYEFCKDINSYTRNTHLTDGFPISGYLSTDCVSFITSGKLVHDENVKKVCEQFYIIYNLLLPSNGAMSASLNNKDCGFLNYWLNDKIRNTNVNKFYNILKEKVIIRNHLDILNDKIYDIDNKELENIKILLNLYKNYENIYKIRTDPKENYNVSCLKIYKECVKDYERAIINCPNTDTNFCKALDEYRKKYETLYRLENVTAKCKENEYLNLPGYDEVLMKIKMKNTLTITISFSLIGLILLTIYLYKFTPVGSRLRNNVNKTKEIKNTINRETHGLLKEYKNNSINIDSGPYNVRYHS